MSIFKLPQKILNNLPSEIWFLIQKLIDDQKKIEENKEIFKKKCENIEHLLYTKYKSDLFAYEPRRIRLVHTAFSDHLLELNFDGFLNENRFWNLCFLTNESFYILRDEEMRNHILFGGLNQN